MSSYEITTLHGPFVHDIRFPILNSPEIRELGNDIFEIAMANGQIAEEFKEVKRNPLLRIGRPENDAEHSWHLCVLASELAAELYPHLDIERVRAFSLIHDLDELKDGDVSTFGATTAQLAAKALRGEEGIAYAMSRLRGITRADFAQYERQDTVEARFVRAVDKLLPLVVTLTSGNLLPLIDEGITTVELLRERYNDMYATIEERFGEEFPELVATYATLCHALDDYFIKNFDSFDSTQVRSNTVEVQHRYLVDTSKIPESIIVDPTIQRREITEGYVGASEDGSETRIRSYDNERFELIVKQPSMVAPDRFERDVISIPPSLFTNMLENCEQQTRKTRVTIPYNRVRIELDVYADDSVIAEIDFNRNNRLPDALLREEAFEPPEWLVERAA